MTIKELCKKAHQTAIEKGFWIPTGGKKKSGFPQVRYRNESELLMLIVSEIGEACEALRKDRRQIGMVEMGPVPWQKDTFEDEIADAFIRLGDLCQALDIDIEWQIKKKMEYNATRPNKHGKKF